MKFSFRRAVSAFLIMLGSGCGKSDLETLPLVKMGMRPADVLTVAGSPRGIRNDGANAAWQYCQDFWGFAKGTYAVVWFQRDAVRGVRLYSPSLSTSCEELLSAFRWSEMKTPYVP